MEILILIVSFIIGVLMSIFCVIVLKEYFKMWRNIDKIVNELEYIHNEIEKTK